MGLNHFADIKKTACFKLQSTCIVKDREVTQIGAGYKWVRPDNWNVRSVYRDELFTILE